MAEVAVAVALAVAAEVVVAVAELVVALVFVVVLLMELAHAVPSIPQIKRCAVPSSPRIKKPTQFPRSPKSNAAHCVNFPTGG